MAYDHILKIFVSPANLSKSQRILSVLSDVGKPNSKCHKNSKW